MIVAFDASTAAFQKKTGTGVYCEELIKAFEKRFPEDKVIHTYRLSRRLKGADHLLPLAANGNRETLLDPWTYYKGKKYDIFHGLNSRLPLLAHSQMIATIHDLFSIFGEFSKPEFREDQSQKLKQMISRAHHIIVPATFTKDELVNRLGISENKITVVGEGVRAAYLNPVNKELARARVLESFKIRNPYILFVGTLEKRKNVKTLVEAYSLLKARKPDCPDLVLVGGPGFEYEEIERAITDSGVKGSIKTLGFVGEMSLAEIYRGADVFAFPSLEEGYGIPVIEAMSCGLPVVSSNTTSLPEVCAGHGWLVNPRSALEIAGALELVLKKEPATVQKTADGQKYAQLKTWTKVAEDTRAVYEKIIRSRSPSAGSRTS